MTLIASQVTGLYTGTVELTDNHHHAKQQAHGHTDTQTTGTHWLDWISLTLLFRNQLRAQLNTKYI